MWDMGLQTSSFLKNTIQNFNKIQERFAYPFLVETDVVEMFYEIPREAILPAVRFLCDFVLEKVRKRKLFWAVNRDGSEVLWGFHNMKQYANFEVKSLLSYLLFEIEVNKFFMGIDNNFQPKILVQKLGVPIGGMLSAQLSDIFCIWRTYQQWLLPRSVFLSFHITSLRYRDNVLYFLLRDEFGGDDQVWLDMYPHETCPFCEVTFLEEVKHTCHMGDVGERLRRWTSFVLGLPIQIEAQGTSLPSIGRQFFCTDFSFSFFPINRVFQKYDVLVQNPRKRFLFEQDLPRKRVSRYQTVKTMSVLYQFLSSDSTNFLYGMVALFFELVNGRLWKVNKTNSEFLKIIGNTLHLERMAIQSVWDNTKVAYKMAESILQFRETCDRL